MTDPQEAIAQAVEETTAALADGLDVGDVALLVKNGVEIAERLDDVPPEKKRELALSYASELLDEFWSSATPAMRKGIAELDIPWVPEGVEAAIIDPVVAAYAPTLLKHFVKLALPSIVDLVITASRGGVQVNTELWVKAGSAIDLIASHGDTITEALGRADSEDQAQEFGAALDALRELLA